jgi:hypothetical protein
VRISWGGCAKPAGKIQIVRVPIPEPISTQHNDQRSRVRNTLLSAIDGGRLDRRLVAPVLSSSFLLIFDAKLNH